MKKLITVFLAALVLSGLGAPQGLQAQNLTVKITKTDNSEETKTSHATLESAMSGVPLGQAVKLEISAGTFNTADWEWLKSKKANFTALTHFTITNGITAVANMPDGANENDAIFNTKLQKVSVAKLEIIGKYAFSQLPALTTASFPQVTKIESFAFCSHKALSVIHLPATPPSVGYDAFFGGSTERYLIIVDSNGTPLEGEAKTNAENAYKTASGGSTWYRWQIGKTPVLYNVTIDPAITNGTLIATPNADVGKDARILLTAIPAAGYQLKEGSLKYKHEGSSYLRPVEYNPMDMPASNITATAEFIVNSMDVTVNGSIHKTGYSLENALSGIALNSITSIEITAGTQFATADWEWIRDYREELNALTHFTITDGVGVVADMPKIDYTGKQRVFNEALQEISVAKMLTVGECAFCNYKALTKVSFSHATNVSDDAFYGCTALTTGSFPRVKKIGDYAFIGNRAFSVISLGANPPELDYYSPFTNLGNTIRYLVLVDADGNELTGEAKTNAENAYKTVNDGNTTDNLWRGWRIGETPKLYTVSIASGITDGTISALPVANVAEGARINIDITPKDNNHFLKVGNLKYQIEGTSEWVEISPNPYFEMPAGNVTITAEFTTNTMEVTVNGNIHKSGNTLENALNGVDLATVTSLSITGGTQFSSSDWMWLRTAKFSALTNLTISDAVGSVAGIPDYYVRDTTAFKNTLRELKVSKLKNIGADAFAYCSALSLVGLPNATTIGDFAFRECPISTLVVPQLTAMYGGAFYGCSSFSNITLGAAPPQIIKSYVGIFPYIPEIRYLILADANGNLLTGEAKTNAEKAYKAVDDGDIEDNLWYGWRIGETPQLYSITIDPTITNGTVMAIPALNLSENGDVKFTFVPATNYQLKSGSLKYKIDGTSEWIEIVNKSIKMPASNITVTAEFIINTLQVTVNGTDNRSGNSLEQALSGLDLSTVTKIEVKSGAQFIEADWIWLRNNRLNFSFLTHFSIADDIGIVEDIPSKFNDPIFIGQLQYVSVAKVKKIGDYAFAYCWSLSSVHFPQATTIGGAAFESCSSLTSADFPFVTTIGWSAFEKCNSLASANFPLATTIDGRAFCVCSSLSSINFPQATTIEFNAFGSCNALTSAKFPLVTSIKRAAFSECQQLSTISFGSTPPSLETDVFRNCPASRRLVLVDAAGAALTGDNKTAAEIAYRAVDDGDAADNLWHGWIIMDKLKNDVSVASGITNGTVTVSPNLQVEIGTEVAITAVPSADYILKAGSIKVYKTGDETITITVSDSKFIMPSYNVTVTAEFVKSTSVNSNEASILGLYPNPTGSTVYIGGLQQPVTVTVYNSAGTPVHTQKIVPGEALELGHLPEGVYMICINNVTLRFVKQ